MEKGKRNGGDNSMRGREKGGRLGKRRYEGGERTNNMGVGNTEKGKSWAEREGERKLGKSMTEERKEGAEKSKGGDREGG